MMTDSRIQTGLMILLRNCIDGCGGSAFDHILHSHSTEQGDLLSSRCWKGTIHSTQQQVRLNARLKKRSHGLLRRLRLQLISYKGNQRQMKEQHAITTQTLSELTGGLEIGNTFDVTDRSADLADGDMGRIL